MVKKSGWIRWRTAAFLFVLTLSGEGWAQMAPAETEESLSEAEISEAVERLRCANEPFFWCSGGIGTEERTALERLSGRFTLCTEWAQSGRPYLAGATLEVTRRDGLLRWRGDDLGPWWCAALPAGDYRLVATGTPLVEYPPQERQITIKKATRPQRLTFLW